MKKNTASDKQIKAWLNYNCSQGNNWITIYKFDEIIGHKDKKYYEVSQTQTNEKSSEHCKLNSQDLRHVYFTYMIDNQLITLIETLNESVYLINNSVSIIEPEPEPVENENEEVEIKSKTIRDDFDIQSDPEIKKIEEITALPQLQSIHSKVFLLKNIRALNKCLTGKELTNIGIKRSKWLSGDLKKIQKDELSQISFMDFIHIGTPKIYLELFEKYISQSGNTLNLTHNYSITTDLLDQIKVNNSITQLILHQNFQIDDFSWFKNFPNLKLINIWHNQRLEYKHIEQIVSTLPNIEVFNLHSCCRINLRVLIPILKLKNLHKLAIDDSYFWCQKSVHELFILSDEWKSIYCPSLQKLAINSKNLTLDVIDYIFSSCSNIQQFIVDEDILTMICRNIIIGYEKDNTLSFHSWQNPNKGFQIHKKVTFKNLFKDTYNSQLFSESMLKKIKQQKEMKNEPEQESVPIELPRQ